MQKQSGSKSKTTSGFVSNEILDRPLKLKNIHSYNDYLYLMYLEVKRSVACWTSQNRKLPQKTEIHLSTKMLIFPEIVKQANQDDLYNYLYASL